MRYLPSASLLALSVVLSGCEVSHRVVCETRADCIREGIQGICAMDSGQCAFADSGCGTGGYRWDSTAEDEFAGRCVSQATLVGGAVDALTNVGENKCGGSQQLDAEPGAPCGMCGMGKYQCSAGTLVCVGEPTLEMPITSERVAVLSENDDDGVMAEAAVDGNQMTSWMSAGATADDPTPSTTDFEWVAAQEECIIAVEILGNHRHHQQRMQRNHSFAGVTVQVVDSEGDTAYSRYYELGDSERLSVRIEEGALGERVRLRFGAHESEECGGFSELEVFAARRRGAPASRAQR